MLYFAYMINRDYKNVDRYKSKPFFLININMDLNLDLLKEEITTFKVHLYALYYLFFKPLLNKLFVRKNYSLRLFFAKFYVVL